jgi:membrane protease YdiL (CAAX protease family)
LAAVTPPRPPSSTGRALGRHEGFVVFLLAAGGFLVGQVLGLLAAVLAASLSNYHGSLTKLTTAAEPPWWFIAASLVGLWVGLLAASALVQRRYRVLIVPDVFVTRWRDLGYVGLGVTLQLFVTLSYLPFHPRHLSAPANKLLGSATGWQFAVIAAMTALGAPLVEELFFRGVLVRALAGLLGGLRRRGVLVAVVVLDGLLFALAHGELVQLPGLAVVGAVLALLYLRTGRLAPSIVTHASFNAVALVAVLAQRAHS